MVCARGCYVRDRRPGDHRGARHEIYSDAKPHRHRDLRQSRGAVQLHRGGRGARDVAARREQGGDSPGGKARRTAAQPHHPPAEPDRGRLGSVSPQCARARGDRERRVGSRALSDRAARHAARVGADELQHPAPRPGATGIPGALSRRHAGAEPRRPPGRPGGRRLRCGDPHRPPAGLEPHRAQDRAMPPGDLRFARLSRTTRRARATGRPARAQLHSVFAAEHAARMASGRRGRRAAHGADQRRGPFEQWAGESRRSHWPAAASCSCRRFISGTSCAAGDSSRCSANSSRRSWPCTPSIRSAAI